MAKKRGNRSNQSSPATGGRRAPSRASQRAPDHTGVGQAIAADRLKRGDGSLIEAAHVGEVLDRMSEPATDLLVWILASMNGKIDGTGALVPLDLAEMAAGWKVTPTDLRRLIEEIGRYVVPAGENMTNRMRLITPIGWEVDEKGEPAIMLTFMIPVRLTSDERSADGAE